MDRRCAIEIQGVPAVLFQAIDATPAYTEDECDALLGLIRNQFGKLSVRYWVTVPGDSADSA